MVLTTYLSSALFLLAASFIVFRIVVRRDYQRIGRLSPISAFLEMLLCMLYFSFPYIYSPPGWAAFWSAETQVGETLKIIGSLTVVAGALTAFPAMAALGFRRSFGQTANSLRQNGFYRVTRNPQLVGGALMPVGIVVLFPSWYSLGWLVIYAAIFHMMVLTEEEHLRSIYGEEYERYCKRVPRYLGFPRSSRYKPSNQVHNS